MQLMNMFIFHQTYQTTQDVKQNNYSFWRPITHFPYHDLWTLSCLLGVRSWWWCDVNMTSTTDQWGLVFREHYGNELMVGNLLSRLL